MHPSSFNASQVNDQPPYLNELSTTADMYAALGELNSWIWRQADALKHEQLTASLHQLLEPGLPDLSLLRAVSVWQNYRTLKFIRGIRISWDYMQREYPVGHLRRESTLISLLIAAAKTINVAFTMPSDISAARQSQDRALTQYIQQILKQGQGDEADPGTGDGD